MCSVSPFTRRLPFTFLVLFGRCQETNNTIRGGKAGLRSWCSCPYLCECKEEAGHVWDSHAHIGLKPQRTCICWTRCSPLPPSIRCFGVLNTKTSSHCCLVMWMNGICVDPPKKKDPFFFFSSQSPGERTPAPLRGQVRRFGLRFTPQTPHTATATEHRPAPASRSVGVIQGAGVFLCWLKGIPSLEECVECNGPHRARQVLSC